MTNKFYKVLGICLLIVIFPVMVVSTTLSLNGTAGNNSNTPVNPDVKPDASYSVTTDFGEPTTLSYDETEKVWEINTVPTRDYYTFWGIKISVDGADKEFKMKTDKTIRVDNEEEGEKLYNAIVVDKNAISCVWSCDYDFCIKFGTAWREFVNPYYKDGGFIFYDMEAIEEVGLLEQIGYFDLDEGDQIKTNIVVKVYTDTTVDNNVITLGTTYQEVDLEWNPQTAGDITFKNLLDTLAGKGANITPNGFNLGIELV